MFSHILEIYMNVSNQFAKAIQLASVLPVEIQDEIAEQWLEDIESEINWQRTLQQPQEYLSELAREALRQSMRGETLVQGFDEIWINSRIFEAIPQFARTH